MSANPAAMHAMAAKYLELAGKTADPGVSEKLRQYAALYRDIAAQAIAKKEQPGGFRDILPEPMRQGLR